MDKRLEDYPHLEKLAIEGYDFNISDYISKGLDIFKRDIGGFVGFTIVYFLIMMAASFIPLGSTIISPALSIGWAIVCYNIVRNQHREFNEFFKGFDDFVQLLLVTIISGLIMTAALIPLGIVAFTSFDMGEVFLGGEPDFGNVSVTTLVIGTLAFMIPLIYIGVAWIWAPYFVVFYKMQFWDAMEASRKIIGRNWWIYFLFLIVLVLINILGILGFGIGLLFTIPATMCMQYIAFAKVTGLHREIEEGGYNPIEDHLVG